MRKILIPLVLVGAAAALVAPRLLKRAFTPPRRDVDQVPSDFGLDATTLWLDGPNGKRLHAWWIPADGTAPVVIVLHGWGGTAADMLPIGPGLHESGFHVLFLDARKHGQSDNEDFMSMPRFAEDLTSAIATMRERSDVDTVGVVAHSVGAAAAIYAAAGATPPDAVVAVAPFAHPGDMMKENFPFPAPVTWAILQVVERMIGHSYDEIAPRNRIGDVTVPVMLMHGEDDAVIPVTDSMELHERLPGSHLIVVPEGTHSDLEPFEPHFETVDGFLHDALVATAG
jgi:pimeloyl-ACP methyl ester carboxylesterase